jgi:hypothetical protein
VVAAVPLASVATDALRRNLRRPRVGAVVLKIFDMLGTSRSFYSFYNFGIKCFLEHDILESEEKIGESKVISPMEKRVI